MVVHIIHRQFVELDTRAALLITRQQLLGDVQFRVAVVGSLRVECLFQSLIAQLVHRILDILDGQVAILVVTDYLPDKLYLCLPQ